jgi:hypothetical protein
MTTVVSLGIVLPVNFQESHSQISFFQKQVNNNILGSASEASMEKEPMSSGKILTSGPRGKARDSYVQQLS